MSVEQTKSIFILFLVLTGCRSGIGGLFRDYTSDKIISPSGKYYLIATVNRTHKSQSDYASVVIHLYNSNGIQQSTVNTHAEDSQKWAIGWDKKQDTVILFSSDIENAVWRIENGRLQNISLTEEFNARANDLKREKYKNE